MKRRPTSVPTAPVPQPEQAWRALSVTNEWIRHADSKIAVTLAFTAATAAMLFNLVHEHQDWNAWYSVVTVLTVVTIVISLSLSVAALAPRITAFRKPKRNDKSLHEEAPINLLFFGDISRAYSTDGDSFGTALSSLTSDSALLTQQIASQIHVNSRIATLKHVRVKWAIRTELVAAIFVAALVIIGLLGEAKWS